MAKWVVQVKEGNRWVNMSKHISSEAAMELYDVLSKYNPSKHYKTKLVGGVEPKIHRNPAPKMSAGAKMKARSIDLPKSTQTTIAEMRKKLGAKKNPAKKKRKQGWLVRAMPKRPQATPLFLYSHNRGFEGFGSIDKARVFASESDAKRAAASVKPYLPPQIARLVIAGPF